MTDALQCLIDQFNLSSNRGASDTTLAALERDLGYGIDPGFRAVLTATDGLDIPPLDAEILSVSAIHDIWRATERGERWQLIIGGWRGEIPVLDTHDSDYFTVACRPPLAPRVIHAPHDDGARLLFRDVSGLFRWLTRSGQANPNSERNPVGDFDDAEPRNADDLAAARELLSVRPLPYGSEKNDLVRYEEACRFGLTLLDASMIDVAATALEAPDMFVRRDARQRLARMPGQAARAALHGDAEAVAAFCADVVEACRAAGIPAEVRDGNLKVDGRGANLDAVFPARRQPNAMGRYIQMVLDHRAGRDPRIRPDYYLKYKG